MTNCIKMSKNIGMRRHAALPAKTAGGMPMISMVAISVAMAVAPAQAQEMEAPTMAAPVQAPPVISPQPAPAAAPTMAPTTAAPPESSALVTTPERAEGLASKGGFDAETVAPEALAQIEREQQARRDAEAAAAKSAAVARASAAQPVPVRAISVARTDSATHPVPAIDAESPAESAAVIPMTSPVAEPAAAPEVMPADGATDWSLLAALAALLGVGGAGGYAATRRRKRKSQGQAATKARGNDTLPASLTAATIAEPRREPVGEEVRPTVAAEQATAQSLESKATTEADFAAFVAGLPALDPQNGKADRGTTMGQRRVASAPRPYLAAADLSRTPGYFTAHVDAMPTPQNPFLTRHKRIKRARYLDGKLTGGKAPTSDSRTNNDGKMEVARSKEPAFA